MDLESFRHLGTNITALRLVDPAQSAASDLLQDWLADPLPSHSGWPAILPTGQHAGIQVSPTVQQPARWDSGETHCWRPTV